MVNNRTYLDHSATTALRPAARDALVDAAGALGNPTSVHTSGRRVRGILDDALQEIAQQLGVPRSWLIMTSGGTEADNLALRGAAHLGPVFGLATDHPAVVQTVQALNGRLLPVHRDGTMDLTALETALDQARSDGAPASLVSAALVNNETGVVQDLSAIAGLAHRYGAAVHTDAVQATGHVQLPDFDTVDLMSLSGHKIGAPVGVGVLVAQPDVKLAAVGTGGGQQRGIRSGTLDAAHAASFAAALRETLADAAAEQARLGSLAERLRAGIRAIDADAVFTAEDSPHAPHIVHVQFPGAVQDAVLFVLDQAGVDCSAGSACSSGVTQASHVLEAMGFEESLMRGAIRFSFGWTSSEQDVDAVLQALPDALERGRAMGRLFA
ncbi:aminotransferase class V-fold PLP-dependent enzyme [Helcobacillus massiliensis]|uniref:cysteine desulfurase n=1 Tax=Helcobacillus massiliensis TaxID=521392 RepID=A0A839QXL6_9MICO|nr:cysteine desulfurase [Helcobacillus massiliensis]